MNTLFKGARLTKAMRNIMALRLLFVMANILGPFAALFLNRHYLLDNSEVALALTLMSAFYLTGNLLGGALTGRYTLRLLLLGASACSSVFVLSAIVLSTSATSIAMVLMFVLCAGVTTPVFSMLTSLAANDDNRIASFGYLHLASNLGAALLFVIGGYLIDLQSHYLMAFAASASIACFLASASLALPERRICTSQNSTKISRNVIEIPRAVIVAGILFFALSVLDAQREYQLPLWLDAIAVDYAANIFAAVGIVNASLVILITQPLIALTSRYSTLANMALAGIFYGIGFGAYAFFEHTAWILSFVVFWTMGEILGITYITALIAQKASLRTQPGLFSLIPILLALARMVSVGIGVSLISSVGFMLSWSLYGLLGLLLGGVYWLRDEKPSASQISSPRRS